MVNGSNGGGGVGVGADSTRLEVLNISNKNARGETVLNDEHLLELMQRYPFLYNRNIRPSEDPDYNEWAWDRITTAFNRSYAVMPTVAARHFSIAELQRRWFTLTPIIKSLSKAYDLNSIPESLRQIVISISAALEPTEHSAKVPTVSEAQLVVLDNLAWIGHLPMVERRRLEAEMMELLLAAELKSRVSVQIDDVAEQRVNQEYEDFLKAIRLKELFVLSSNDAAAIEATAAATSTVLAAQTNSLGTSPFVCDSDAVDTNSQSTISVEDVEDMLIAEEPLLEPLPVPRLHYHQVRPCVVRLKRLNLEEYMPLAQIARIKHERTGLL